MRLVRDRGDEVDAAHKRKASHAATCEAFRSIFYLLCYIAV